MLKEIAREICYVAVIFALVALFMFVLEGAIADHRYDTAVERGLIFYAPDVDGFAESMMKGAGR